MDQKSKSRLFEMFMEKQPAADPEKRWTILDVKAVIYNFLAESYGGEDYSSATDTLCREMIWDRLERRVKQAQEYVEEGFAEQITVNLAGEIGNDPVGEEVCQMLEEEITRIIPNIVKDYLVRTPTSYYTTIYNHSEEITDLIRLEIKKNPTISVLYDK